MNESFTCKLCDRKLAAFTELESSLCFVVSDVHSRQQAFVYQNTSTSATSQRDTLSTRIGNMRHSQMIALSLVCLPFTVTVADEAKTKPVVETTVEDSAQAATVDDDVKESDATETKMADEWKPRFLVSLFVREGGRSSTSKRTVQIPYYQTEIESRQGFGKMERVTVRKLNFRETEETFNAPGLAALYCDQFATQLTNSETTPYGFECAGRLHLQLGRMTIGAESATLKDGQLNLTNARIQQDSTTATAEQLTIQLTLHGMSTFPFNRPIPQDLPWGMMPVPLPTKELSPRTAAPFPVDDELGGFHDPGVDSRYPFGANHRGSKEQRRGVRTFSGAGSADSSPARESNLKDVRPGLDFAAPSEGRFGDPLPTIIR